MPTNIEFKARIHDFAAASDTAGDLAGSPPRIIRQEDVFFQCTKGRLKLRILDEGQGELIHYLRDDVSGLKPSFYTVVPTPAPLELRRLLANALGETIVVRKTRALYLVGSTRIHIDEVEGLGAFMEVEVVLEEGQTAEQGKEIAAAIIQHFSIREPDLIATAYADLLK
jgi:predicted adenylyl cyclase CyaB